MINSDSIDVEVSSKGIIEGKAYTNNTIEGEISSENLEAEISSNGTIEGEVASNNSITGEVNNIKVGIVEVYDYNSASNKPKINGVELKGNKTLEDLGIQPKGNYLTEIPREYVDEDELNYAIKDFATKSYVDNEIATFDFIKIVNELPDTGLENRFYFVPKADTQTQDLFDEYAWINNKWEWITTKQIEVDLTNYALKNEIPTKTSELENDNGFITDYEENDPTVPNHVKSIKETDINNWNNKVDKVEGKTLTTNDFTNDYKSKVDANTTNRHTHSNKTSLDKITEDKITEWDNKVSSSELNEMLWEDITDVDSEIITYASNMYFSYKKMYRIANKFIYFVCAGAAPTASTAITIGNINEFYRPPVTTYIGGCGPENKPITVSASSGGDIIARLTSNGTWFGFSIMWAIE